MSLDSKICQPLRKLPPPVFLFSMRGEPRIFYNLMCNLAAAFDRRGTVHDGRQSEPDQFQTAGLVHLAVFSIPVF